MSKKSNCKNQSFRKPKCSPNTSGFVTVKKDASSMIDEARMLKQLLWQKINQNDLKQEKLLIDLAQRIRIRLHFSDTFSLQMNLPSSLTIHQLEQLAGSYVKLHLKYRPSQRHVYSGLISKNPLNSLNPNELNYLNLKQSQSSQQIDNCLNNNQTNNKSIQFNKVALIIVRYIITSMILANNLSTSGIDRGRQMTLKQLMVREKQIERYYKNSKHLFLCKNIQTSTQSQHAYEIYVRYDRLSSQHNRTQYINIQDQQASTNINQHQHSFFNLQYSSRKWLEKEKDFLDQNVTNNCDVNKITDASKINDMSKINDVRKLIRLQRQDKNKFQQNQQVFARMMKWLNQTIVETWVTLGQMIMSSGQHSKSTISSGKIIDNIKTIPVRAKGHSQIYELLIIQHNPSQVTSKSLIANNMLKELESNNELQMTHKLHERYCLQTLHNTNRSLLQFRYHQIIILQQQSHCLVQAGEYLRYVFKQLGQMLSQQKLNGTYSQLQYRSQNSHSTQTLVSQLEQHVKLIYTQLILTIKHLPNLYCMDENANNEWETSNQSICPVLSLFMISPQSKTKQDLVKVNTIQLIKRTPQILYQGNPTLSKQHKNKKNNIWIQQLNLEIKYIITILSIDQSQLLNKWFTNEIIYNYQELTTINNIPIPNYNSSLVNLLYSSTINYLNTCLGNSVKNLVQQPHENQTLLSSIAKHLSTQLYKSNQTILKLQTQLNINQSNQTLKIIHFYHPPNTIELLAGEQIDIYERQTTLKKKKLSVKNYNSKRNSSDRLLYQHLHQRSISEFKPEKNKTRLNNTLQKQPRKPKRSRKMKQNKRLNILSIPKTIKSMKKQYTKVKRGVQISK